MPWKGCSAWQRARSPEQKDERRKAIMEAAAGLFQEQDYDKVSLNAIARRAGMAKSNVYRYFDTKEEIFLHLFLEDVAELFDEMTKRLEELTGCNDPQSIAASMVDCLSERERFAELMSILSVVLERNLSVEVAVWFKKEVHAYMPELQVMLQQALPDVTEEQAGEIIHYFFIMSAGIWSAANPSPTLDEALSRPELAHMRMDFRRDLTRALCVMMHGVKAAGTDTN